MRRALACGVLGVLLHGAGRSSLPAQEVRTALASDSIHVGDVVPLAVRVTIDRDERVVWPDTVPINAVSAEVENVARVRERVDTLADGRLRVTGIYSVTPWRPGEAALPELPVRVVASDEQVRTLVARLPTLEVASVLPADTAGLDPRPAKGVIGPSWAWLPLLLLLLVLVAAVALLIAWWRRRPSREVTPARTAIPPREAALAALRAAREAGLVERGELKEFYTRIAAAVRAYLAAVDPVWSEDLTTTELVGRVRSTAGAGAASGLAAVLRPADHVKFARRHPDAATAYEEWEAAHEWVERFEGPSAQPDVEEAA